MKDDRIARVLLDPVLLIGTGCSVVLGVLFYVKSDVATGLGVIAGLLGVLIAMQVQVVLLLLRRSAERSRHARMVEAMERIPWLDAVLEKLISAAAKVDEDFAGTPAIGASQRAFQDCLDRLTDLQRGHFTAPYGDMTLAHLLTTTSSREIWATSVEEIDLSWWRSPRSQRYWQLQREALERGVDITRIFIYREWTDELRELAESQARAGVTVLRIPRDQVRADLRTDIVIWDQRCIFETRSNAAGEPTSNFFSVAEQDLAAAVDQFTRLRHNALPVWVEQ